jgi:hypothetical protein
MVGANMEDRYRKALEEFGVLTYLSRTSSGPEGISMEDIMKSIFYSAPGIDYHRRSIKSMVVDGEIAAKEGRLQDYTQMINVRDILDVARRLVAKEINKHDIAYLRSTLLEGVLGIDGSGFRRFRNRSGHYITAPTDEVSGGMDALVELLNKPSKNGIDAFSNAVDFFLGFVKLHPFDECVGRTDRIVTNSYLIAHGINPIFLNNNGSSHSYASALDISYFSGYYGAFIAIALISAMDNKNKEAFISKIKSESYTDPTMIELKNLVLSVTKELGGEELVRVLGLSENLYCKDSAPLLLSGLFALKTYGMDSEIIEMALRHGDSGIRAVGFYTAEAVNFAKYKNAFIDAAIHDPSVDVRMVAVGILGTRKELDGKTALRILASSTEETVLISLGSAMRFAAGGDVECMDVINAICASRSKDVRFRGFQAMMVHGDNGAVANTIALLKDEPLEMFRAAVTELKRVGRINDYDIAKSLADVVSGDVQKRKMLLGQLAMDGRVSDAYQGMLNDVLTSDNSGAVEKIYAAYLFGTKYGYAQTVSMYPDAESLKDHMLFGIVKTILMVDEANGDADKLKQRIPELVSNSALQNFVLASELGSLMKKGGLDGELVKKVAEAIEAAEPVIRNSDRFYNLTAQLKRKAAMMNDLIEAGRTGVAATNSTGLKNARIKR